MTVDQATIDEVRTIVDTFSALAWPAPKAEIYPVAESLGWTLRSDREKGVDCIASFSVKREVLLIVIHEQFADVERFEEARGIPGDRDPVADVPR